MKKFLIIRFSSIGDIVLTSPVIRSLHKAFPKAEIHYLTKAAYAPLLQHNPYVSKLHLLDENFGSLMGHLKEEKFDHIFDLHHNLRTLRAKWLLRRPSTAFHKANVDKYLLTKPLLRKWAKPIRHIVQRYGDTLKGVGAALDGEGLDLFIPEGMGPHAREIVEIHFGAKKPIAVVLGAKFATKRWVPGYFPELLNKLGMPVLLLGGKDAQKEANTIAGQLIVPFHNAVAGQGLLESAALLRECQSVLTHDTGFMHIAAAFGMQIYSLWGNTIPEFGMTPYKTTFQAFETGGLSCRPCSKIGYPACPKGHFRCMSDLTPEKVLGEINAG